MNILDSGVPRQSAEGSLRVRSGSLRVRSWEGVEKPLTQAGQKGLRCKAREKLTSGSVLRKYVGARQSSATITTAGLGVSRRADASSEELEACLR